uniref:Sod4 n=1 Tax=Arundo donax TaxID=35708 RepID=A0A0A9GQ72_ARUDO
MAVLIFWCPMLLTSRIEVWPSRHATIGGVTKRVHMEPVKPWLESRDTSGHSSRTISLLGKEDGALDTLSARKDSNGLHHCVYVISGDPRVQRELRSS